MENKDPSAQDKRNEENLDKMAWGIEIDAVDDKGNEKLKYRSNFSFDLSYNKEWLSKRTAKISSELNELNDHDLLARQNANLETVTGLLLELLKEILQTNQRVLSELEKIDDRLVDVELSIRHIPVPPPSFGGEGIPDRTVRDIAQISVNVSSIKDALGNVS